MGIRWPEKVSNEKVYEIAQAKPWNYNKNTSNKMIPTFNKINRLYPSRNIFKIIK